MRQYSADQVSVAWLFSGDLSRGLAAGSFIQEQRDNDTWKFKPDGVGGIIRMFNKNRSGNLTLLLDRESQEHQILQTIHNADRVLQLFVGPLTVTNENTKEYSLFNQASIVVDPPLQLGVGPSVVAWNFKFQSMITQSFGFNNNVVGS